METGTVILSRDGTEKGHVMDGIADCDMEGCRGECVEVKWEDGTTTFPCTHGLDLIDDDTFQII